MTGVTQTAHELSGAIPSGPHTPVPVERSEPAPAVHPLRTGWLPAGSGLGWLEELRAEHEALVAQWHRIADASDSYPARCSQVAEGYRAAVRAAIVRDKPVPKVPDAMHPERRRVESQELEAAAREAAAGVTDVARRAVGVLLERRVELGALGGEAGPLREQLDAVISRRAEGVAVAGRRAALLKARDETRDAFVALKQQQDAEYQAVALRNANLSLGVGLPAGWEPGEPVLEHSVDVRRQRAELDAARIAGREAEAALNEFDSGEARAFKQRRPPLLVRLGLVEA